MPPKRPFERAEQAIRDVLPPTVAVQPGTKPGDLIVAGRRLRVRWAGKGSLPDVRTAIETGQRPDIVVASRLTPGARTALTEAGIGWVDETGAAEIAVGTLVVSRTPVQPRPTAREDRSGWSGARLAVAEALLCGHRATVAACRSATGLSEASCTNALAFLSELQLLTAPAKRGPTSARAVVDSRRLLEAYAAAASDHRSKLELRVGAVWRDQIAGIAQVGRQWESRGLDWTVTGAAAASLVAPYLTGFTGAEIYLEAKTISALASAAAVANMRPVEGGRVILRPRPTVTTDRLATTVEDVRVAPWPRIYADLRSVGVRGEDAAEHLWEVVGARELRAESSGT